MRTYLLPKDGNFYKTALHVHTDISDGSMTTDEVKSIYKSNGFSVVAITDHQIMLPHPELNDEDFLTITATEVAKNKGDYNLEPSTHYNVYSPDPNATTYPYFDINSFWPRIEHAKSFLPKEAFDYPVIDYTYEPEDLNKVIAACNEAGYLVSYNHPVNSLQTYSFYGKLRGLWGAECFNSGCYLGGYYEDMRVTDDLYREGERFINPIAADDSHAPRTCCLGYTMVKADKLEYTTIFNALKTGQFYSTTGIHITDLYLEDATLHIECDGADEINLTTPLRFKKVAKSNGTPLTSVDLDLSGLFKMFNENPEVTKNTYFRLDLKRNDGKEAHTRAYFLDTL